MAARSIGTATISFGLVSVPVNLYSSSESKSSISFNMLHKKCGTRLKQQYVCPKDNNEVVTREDTSKGYEFAKDQYVILTPEELKALEEKATSTIDVIEFVPLAQVDREYLEKVYYLGPDKGGDRAYRLLAKALQETGRSGQAQRREPDQRDALDRVQLRTRAEHLEHPRHDVDLDVAVLELADDLERLFVRLGAECDHHAVRGVLLDEPGEIVRIAEQLDLARSVE